MTEIFWNASGNLKQSNKFPTSVRCQLNRQNSSVQELRENYPDRRWDFNPRRNEIVQILTSEVPMMIL